MAQITPYQGFFLMKMGVKINIKYLLFGDFLSLLKYETCFDLKKKGKINFYYAKLHLGGKYIYKRNERGK